MGILATSRQRTLVTAAAALIAAAAVFGAGFVAARATDGESPPPQDEPATAVRPGNVPAITLSRGEGSTFGAAVSPVPPIAADGGGRSAALFPGAPGFTTEGGCPAAMPDISAGSGIDLARAGFGVRLLGAGFTLRSFSVRAEGPCGPDGRASTGTLVVETSWVHGATSFDVSVTQRVASDPRPNIVSPQAAQAWSDGYTLTAWVNAYATAGVGTKDIAGAPVTQADGRGDEVLRLALAQLAPAVAERCYYRQEQGSWADLARMGIGDPRPAMPAGVAEQYSGFVVFAEPPADCAAPPLGPMASFSASFASDPNSKSGMVVQLGAYPVGPGNDPGYGYLGDGNASWSNGKYTFNVSGYANQGALPRAAIEAIARAMDPGFSTACFTTTRELAPAEVASLGLRAPVPPDGFALAKSSLVITDGPAASCPGRAGATDFPQVMLNWVFQGSGGIIEAAAYRNGDQSASDRGGYIQDGSLSWSDARGTRYMVSGHSAEGGRPIDREVLVQVARSMDPTLDAGSLAEGQAAPSMKPLPMRD